LAGERGDKRTFATLDGLRGVAALFVAMRHTSFFHGLNIHGGYLAVDLFFVLSGFVIAHAYERRLAQGLSPGRFLAMRYLRLWPVYVLGALLGLIAAASHALPGHDNMPLRDVARTAPFALAMLPGPHIKPMLYPVNSVAWSLALELLINGVYAFTWRYLRDARVLIAVLAASAAALIAACLGFGKLDIGFQWSDAVGGLPRVAFSFAAGLAVHRLYRAGAWRPRLPAWAPLALLVPLLWVKLDEIVYPLVCVLAVFPVMVLASANTEPSRRAAPAFAWLGAVSFPLYALHKPVGELVTLLAHRAWPRGDHLGPWIGVPYLAAMCLVCALVERRYDGPVRRVLMGGFDNLMVHVLALAARARQLAGRPAPAQSSLTADRGA
jgi:peptidoglycan/LPS O-acetylase OafA/YrhL